MEEASKNGMKGWKVAKEGMKERGKQGRKEGKDDGEGRDEGRKHGMKGWEGWRKERRIE